MGIYDNKISKLEKDISLMKNNDMFIRSLKDLFNSNTKVDDTIIQNLIDIIHGDEVFSVLEEKLIAFNKDIKSMSYNINGIASFVSGFGNPLLFLEGLLPILGLSKKVKNRETAIHDFYDEVLLKYKSLN